VATSSNIIVRPINATVAAMNRYSQFLYQPPKETIRGIKPDAFYSPLNPVAPMGPAGVEPRGFQYWSGQNLLWTPRADAVYSAAQLKTLATYPLARICIENVKDVVCRAGWAIQAIPEPGETKKQVEARTKGDEVILKLSRFFEKPDREHTWEEWVRPLLEDMLVIDAASIYIRKTLGGDLAELVVLRGESIVRYIDVNGLTPMPPDPAYAQNWWGIPLVNLTTDQLIYKPRNIVPRNTVSSQLYGMSPTEQLALEIEFGQARLQFRLAYYTEGSIPGMLQIVPKGTPSDKITDAMLATNSELAGNFAKRWQLRLIQGFADAAKGEKDQVVMTKEPLLSDATDEIHAREIAFGYGCSPQRLMKAMNRASAEQSDDAAEMEGTLPYISWLKKSVMDYLIRFKLGYTDYEWVPDPFKEPSFEKMAKAIDAIQSKPVLTINEAREKLGEEKRSEPEADMLGMATPTGWVPIGLATAQAGAEVTPDGKVTIKQPAPGDTPEGGKANGKPASAVSKPNDKAPADDAGKAARARTNFGFGAVIDVSTGGVSYGSFTTPSEPPVVTVTKYSEDEERDEHGRWSGGGASIAESTSEGDKKQIHAALGYFKTGELPRGMVVHVSDKDSASAYAVTKGKDVYLYSSTMQEHPAFIATVLKHESIHTEQDYRTMTSAQREYEAHNKTSSWALNHAAVAKDPSEKAAFTRAYHEASGAASHYAAQRYKRTTGDAIEKASAHDTRRAVIHAERSHPHTVKAAVHAQKVLADQFKQMRRKTTRILMKHLDLRKSEKSDAYDAIRKSINENWKTIADDTWQDFEAAAIAGASTGALQLELDDQGLIDKINQQAADWARERSAELVGMRRTDTGRLVRNPNAQWAITDTTRDKLRRAIADVFETEDANLTTVEEAITKAGIFDDQRATMIARTEMSRAQTMSNMLSWKESGQVVEVGWQLSADHNDASNCDCSDNADNSPYPIEDVPEFPAHPNCLCALVLETLKGEEE
jgi:hypothetical protein